MKKILLLIVLFVLIGCDEETPIDFNGSVKINKTNGAITTITVEFPAPITAKNKANTDRLIKEMESLLVDLKYAQEQINVIENQ